MRLWKVKARSAWAWRCWPGGHCAVSGAYGRGDDGNGKRYVRFFCGPDCERKAERDRSRALVEVRRVDEELAA